MYVAHFIVPRLCSIISINTLLSNKTRGYPSVMVRRRNIDIMLFEIHHKTVVNMV